MGHSSKDRVQQRRRKFDVSALQWDRKDFQKFLDNQKRYTFILDNSVEFCSFLVVLLLGENIEIWDYFRKYLIFLAVLHDV